jgi:uncharacterized OsmC-like protein
LTGTARGEVEADQGVLVLKRIHLTLSIAAPATAWPTVERVHGVYADKCPVYRSLKDSIRITSSVELRPGA